MRVLVRFTASQVEVTAAIGEANLQRFIRALVRSGHLAIERPRALGRPGSFTIYRLARDSGPKAPILWNDGCVFDENLQLLFGPDGALASGVEGDDLLAAVRLRVERRASVNKPRSVRLNDERWTKLRRLGICWLERAIDLAKEPPKPG